MKSLRKKVVQEVEYGLYVWEMPDGRWVGDDDGNFLNVAAMAGDQKKIAILKDAVKAHGIITGSPYFLAGHRRVTEEEFEEQKQRLRWGLIPDELDAPAYAEEEKFRSQGGR